MRHIPDGHPRVYYHSAVPDGWVTHPGVGANSAVVGGWDGDMTVPNNDVVHGDDGGEEEGMAVDVPATQFAGTSSAAIDGVIVLRRFFRQAGGVLDHIFDNGT